MPVTIEGAKQAQQALRELADMAVSAVEISFQKLKPQMLNAARGNTPVLTGFLQSRNYVDIKSKDEMEFGNDADYAGFVEYGTSKQVAQPFWGPVLSILAKEFPKIYIEKLDEAAE